jgi:putative colanic acid biosynthesis acetyltransferase WcaF
MGNFPEDTYTGPSFPLSNRLRRVIWNFVWLFLFRTSPRPLHGWRRFLLRLFGANVGRGAHIYPAAVIWAPWNLQIGEQCGVANGAILYSQAKITLGVRSVISQGVHLCTGTHDFSVRGMPLVTRPIVVEAEVWLAAECFVLPGVTIGEGAVVGARSVVTRDLPSWMVCAGHPCRPIKPRAVKQPS